MARHINLSPTDVSAIVDMALSDHVAFDTIREEYGLSDAEVKAVMRSHLKPSSYRAWRKRVRRFSDRREHYK